MFFSGTLHESFDDQWLHALLFITFMSALFLFILSTMPCSETMSTLLFLSDKTYIYV
jgi:ABC-type multidrug transport system permease subunit